MKHSRKKRAPEIAAENVSSLSEKVEDLELFRLGYRFEFFEKLRQEDDLPTTYIALEAIGALASARERGRTDQKLKEIWPESWGSDSVSIPLGVALVLAEMWKSYLTDEFGKSLGEAFGIEGGSQGRHQVKSMVATLDRQLVYAREVESLYLCSQASDEPLSLQGSIDVVAAQNGIGVETIKNAHKKYRDYIRRHLRDLDMLRG